MADYSIKLAPNIQTILFYCSYVAWEWPSVQLPPILFDNCAYSSKVLICPKDMLDHLHLNIYKVGNNAASNIDRTYEVNLIRLVKVLHGQTFLT